MFNVLSQFMELILYHGCKHNGRFFLNLQDQTSGGSVDDRLKTIVTYCVVVTHQISHHSNRFGRRLNFAIITPTYTHT